MARSEVTLRDALVGKVEDLIVTSTNRIVSGSVTDHVVYREQVARIKALKDAIDVINDTFRTAEDE